LGSLPALLPAWSKGLEKVRLFIDVDPLSTFF
jgi:hypothetical protein